MTNQKEKKLRHIVGTFLIQAEGAFLNGSIQEQDGKYKITPPKTLKEFNNKIPYVSAQAWRRWLRDTYIDEYNEATTPIETTGIDSGEKKDTFTTKKVGLDIDPVIYAEHDIFGYMTSKEGQGKGDVKATIRNSPFTSSILMSVRKSGWEGIDHGFVYPKSVAISLYKEILDELTEENKNPISEENRSKIEVVKKVLNKNINRDDLVKRLSDKLEKIEDKEGKEKIKQAIVKIKGTIPSPLPYTTKFYNSQLQGIFGLAYHRLGLFRNAGDREEIENTLVDKYLDDKIELVQTDDKSAKIYQLKNKTTKFERTEKILKSLAVLRGGAKQAQFGTDVSPKVIIVAGLTSGNLIFNDLFEDTKEIVTSGFETKDGINESKVIGGVRLKLDALEQIIWDYKDRIVTPVYIGIRYGYLSKSSEKELKDWVVKDGKFEENTDNENNIPKIILCSPIQAIDKLLQKVENLEIPEEQKKK